MKVRIFTPADNEPDIHSVDIPEVQAYVEFIKKFGVLDENGAVCKVDSVLYDSHQNAIDIVCVEAD